MTAVFKNNYLGGSVTFDVDMSELGCECQAGVYLTELGESCFWNNKDPGVQSACNSVDIMKANYVGFEAGSAPCVVGECDKSGICDQSTSSLDYGPSSFFKIDTTQSFSV